MREFGKLLIVSAIISSCVAIAGNFWRSTRTNKSLERRVEHLEKCKNAHRDLIQWILRNRNHLYDVLFEYEITPETIEVLDGEMCEPCKNGWATIECPCKCKYKTIETGRYFLMKKAMGRN